MSRQIKFRAWDGSRMVTEPGYIQVHTDKDFHVFIDESGQWENDGIHLMQFTGLQDKAGRDIYEGDLVRIEKWHGMVRLVSWINHSLEYGLCDPKGEADTYFKFTENNFTNDKLRFEARELEVIGNIYETPHLKTSYL